MTTRAGSHAGRGFRYQDAVGARLVIGAWASDLRYGDLTPEGLDDFELEGEAGHAFVQAKSRRDQLGRFQANRVAGFVRDLWERWIAAGKARSELILVLERSVTGLADASDPMMDVRLSRSDPVGRLLANDARASKLLERTRVVVMSAPMEESVNLISQRLGCPPLAARIYYGAIADQVGELSDSNGERSPGSFLTLSLSDVERTIDRLSVAISIDDMEAAFRHGLCEPVNFLEPLPEPDFYNGVDVQPGHLAAGLLAERPEARGHVLDALERRHGALIAGPSGSGKSGLMWEAAHAARHTVRWFRVRHAAAANVPTLLRLADTFRASNHSPVGFVIDDVGRGRVDLWNILVREAASRPDVVVLGSIREEDVFLLEERARIPELREKPDEELAERIWSELEARGETNWAGWKEAWILSSALLLEYVHVLTQGRRIVDVLQEQVDRRMREKRDYEIQVIRLASAAGRAGATLDVERLQAELSMSDEQTGRVLRRLLDEHLIREVGEARIGSLHQIRANHLFEIAHRIPPPTITTTISRTTRCVAIEDIEGYTARTLAYEPESATSLIEVLVSRLRERSNLREIADALRGLDRGRIANVVEEWLPELEKLGVPPTQATNAAMFAVADTKDFGIDRLKPLCDASQLLRIKFRGEDPRMPLLQELFGELATLLAVASPEELTDFLVALSGVNVPREIIDALRLLGPDLLHDDLAKVQALLETAYHISPEVAEIWVDRVGQGKLLHRISSETPWASEPILSDEPEGLAAAADIFHISDRIQPNIHDEVVALCERLFAFAPRAELTISNALAPDSTPSGIGDYALATKRIPRANLPPKALPQRNRRWITAVAERVGEQSMTQYLAKAKKLLDQLIAPLEDVVDGVLRGKRHDRHLGSLGAIHEAAQTLTRPANADQLITAGESGIGVSDLQNIVFHCSADLIRDLIYLPDRWAASVSSCDQIVEQIDRAGQEPWHLLGGVPPTLGRMRRLVESLRLVIGEAGSRGIKAAYLFGGLGKKADRKNALRLVAADIEVSIRAELRRLQRRLEKTVADAGFSAKASARPVKDITGPWPFAEALVIVSIDSLFDWLTQAGELLKSLREVAGDGRQLVVVPARGDLAVSALSFSGVSRFYPLPFLDNDWLSSLDFRLLEGPRTTTFERLVTALMEVSAIREFECATNDRAPPERVALQSALDVIEQSTSELHALLPDEAIEIWSLFYSLIESIREGDIFFARMIWEAMHEQKLAPEVGTFLAMRLTIMEYDALEALEA